MLRIVCSLFFLFSNVEAVMFSSVYVEATDIRYTQKKKKFSSISLKINKVPPTFSTNTTNIETYTTTRLTQAPLGTPPGLQNHESTPLLLNESQASY